MASSQSGGNVSSGGPLSSFALNPAVEAAMRGYSNSRATMAPNPEEDVRNLVPPPLETLPPAVPWEGQQVMPSREALLTGEVPVMSEQNPEGISIQEEDDLARLTEAPYLPRMDQEVQGVDERGEPTRQGFPADWTLQLAAEQGNLEQTRAALRNVTSPDPTVRENAALHLASMMQTSEMGRMASDQTSPWAKAKLGQQTALQESFNKDPIELKKHLTSVAAQMQPTLNTISDFAKEALFDPEEATMWVVGDDNYKYTVGVRALMDEAEALKTDPMNLLDPNSRESRMIQFIMGNAYLHAVAQSVGAAGKGENTPETEQDWRDDSSAIGDFINSVRHGAVIGFKNAGIDPGKYNMDEFATAMTYHGINKGQLKTMHDPVQGRVMLIPQGGTKTVAERVARITDILTGQPSRGRMGVVPMPSGQGLLDRGTGLVKKAITKGLRAFKRDVAESTKNILGSVGLIFTPTLLARKEAELHLITKPENLEMDPDDPENKLPLYSTHPLANRLGLHKGAYDTAKANVMYPKGYDSTDPQQRADYEQLQKERARDVMQMKFREVELFMQAAKESSGRVRFNRFTHALNNQRFYVNTFDGDYMGSKNIIREVLTFSKRDFVDPASLFDVKEINRLFRVAEQLWAGDPRSEAWGGVVANRMNNMPQTDLAALGTMMNTVLYYTSAIEKYTVDGVEANVSQAAPLTIIKLYKPEMAQHLAELGMQLSTYVKNGDHLPPQQGQQQAGLKPDPEMMKLWAATEKGSSQGVLSLWDDLYRAQEAFKNNIREPVDLTHHSIADGRQSGILLQSLMYGMKHAGDARVVAALAQPSMWMPDLRAQVFASFLEKIRLNFEEDHPEKVQAWASYFRELADKSDVEGVAKSWIKKPLMQAAYSKNVMMFYSELIESLTEDEDSNAAWETHVRDVYRGSTSAAAEDLRQALGDSLREVIDGPSNKVLANFGQWLGVLNQAMYLELPSGDTAVIVPTENAPVNASKGITGRSVVREKSDITGQTIQLKSPNFKTLEFIDAGTGEPTSIALRSQQNAPAAKRRRLHQDRQKQERREDTEPAGYAMRRQLAVMMVQALDGDLIKWATHLVNPPRTRTKAGPSPIMWVHDSSISTPGQALKYLHAYNNMALPNVAKYMTTLGEKMEKAEAEAREVVGKKLAAMEAGGELVGIGEEGDFPALGALFWEWEAKINNQGWRDMWKDPKKLRERTTRVKEILANARSNGWRGALDFTDSDGEIDPNWPRWKRELAVSPMQAKHLFKLAKTLLQLQKGEPDDAFSVWVGAHKERVRNTIKALNSIAEFGGRTHLAPQKGRSATMAPQAKAPINSKAARTAREAEADRIRLEVEEQLQLMNDTPVAKPDDVTDTGRSQDDAEAFKKRLLREGMSKQLMTTLNQRGLTASEADIKTAVMDHGDKEGMTFSKLVDLLVKAGRTQPTRRAARSGAPKPAPMKEDIDLGPDTDDESFDF
jgi:hypothetical protein